MRVFLLGGDTDEATLLEFFAVVGHILVVNLFLGFVAALAVRLGSALVEPLTDVGIGESSVTVGLLLRVFAENLVKTEQDRVFLRLVELLEHNEVVL